MTTAQVALVTGSGKRRVGWHVAEALARRGYALAVHYRTSAAEAAETIASLREHGADAFGFQADLTNESAVRSMVGGVLERFGRIDALVNGAGTSAVCSLEELTDDDWQAQWELHVMAPMRLMRAAAPVMAERGWGRIVNVCSSSGKRPSGTNMAYSVTKAAELSLSRAFADLFAARGVLVNSVSPGPVAGDLWLARGGLADQSAQARGISREEVLEATASRQPIGRLGTEEEIAAVIVFLCSEPASNVAGASWSVDGGAVPVII